MVPASAARWRISRLTVLPPGLTNGQRWRWALHRKWPVAGAVLGIALMLALGALLPIAADVVIVVVGYCSGLWITARVARDVRAESRVIEVCTTVTTTGMRIRGDRELFDSVRAELQMLSAWRSRGMVSPVEFEAAWARAYDCLPADATASRVARHHS